MKIKKCMGWIQKATAVLLAVTCSIGMLTYQASVPESETGIVASAYSSGDYKVNTKSGVNVRSKANDTSSKTKLGAATNGTSFTVDQISGNWGHTKSIKCTNGTREGWVCLDFCTQMSTPNVISTIINGIQTVTDAIVSIFTSGKYQVSLSSGYLNVRSGPSTSHSVVKKLNNGATVQIVSKTGDWGQLANNEGYVHMQYCKRVGGNDWTLNAVSKGVDYCISPECAPNSVLDVAGWGTENNTIVHLWTKHGGANQQFTAVLVSEEAGYYAFRDVNSGKVLDVCDYKEENGAQIQLYDYHGGANQLWHIVDAGNGYYYIRSKMNPSFFLDIGGASSDDGTKVQLYEGNGTSAQKFKFTKAENTGGSGSNEPTYLVNTSSKPASNVITYSKARDGDTYLSRNFKVSEFACHDGSDTVLIDTQLVYYLQMIRDHFGKAVYINSGYRTVEHNKNENGADGSLHTFGKAADIRIPGVSVGEIEQYAKQIGVKAAVAYYGSKSGRGYFVHIDTRSKPATWKGVYKE